MTKNAGQQGSRYRKTRLTGFFSCLFMLVFFAVSDLSYAHQEIMEATPEGYRYAVRLPENYDTAKKYPVVFCFHNRGDGIEATRIFGYASYRLNWITVGFMDLGFSELDKKAWKKIISSQEAVLKDIQAKYSVNPQKFVAAGFAEGTAMAFTLAYAHPSNFKGILACSGDFGLGELSAFVPVYWLVGNDDYKLPDVRRAYNRLDDRGAKATLHIFEGAHQWPSERNIISGFIWIIQANKQK